VAIDLKDMLERAGNWPERAQRELADAASEIEAGLEQVYQATAEELNAIDAADTSGIADDAEAAGAFRAFRTV
jgi:hypothetical protein